MIGCFFGKKIHKLKTIKPQELIDFQNRYYDNHGYFPSPALWTWSLACVIFLSFFFFFRFFSLAV